MLVETNSYPGSKNIGRRFSAGVLWTIVGNISWRGLSVVASIFMARLLGPRDFGGLGMIRSTVNMFSVYAGFRLGITSSRYIAKYKFQDPVRAAAILQLSNRFAFILCAILAIILVLLAPRLASGSLSNPELATGLAIGAGLLFFLVIGNILEAALTGFENYRAIAKISLLRGAATLILCIPMTYFWGLEGAVGGLAVTAAIVIIPLIFAIKREAAIMGFPTRLSWKRIRHEMPVLWTFALPGVLMGVLLSTMDWVARLMLANQVDGYAQLGLFAAADQWRTVILFLPATLARVALPIMSATHGEGDDGFKDTAVMQMRIIGNIALPLTIFIIGFSRPLTGLFGKLYTGTEEIIPLLMLSVFIFSLNQSLKVVYDGAGRRWSNLVMYISHAVIFLAGCLMLIPRYGAKGLALTYLLAYLQLFLAQAVYLHSVIVPGLMKYLLYFYAYSVVLLAICYLVQTNLGQIAAMEINAILFLMAFAPITFKLKKLPHISKNVETQQP